MLKGNVEVKPPGAVLLVSGNPAKKDTIIFCNFVLKGLTVCI